MKSQTETDKLRARLPYTDSQLAHLHRRHGYYFSQDEDGRYWWSYESLVNILRRHRGMRSR